MLDDFDDLVKLLDKKKLSTKSRPFHLATDLKMPYQHVANVVCVITLPLTADFLVKPGANLVTNLVTRRRIVGQRRGREVM